MKERILSVILFLSAAVTIWLIVAELPRKNYAKPATDFVEAIRSGTTVPLQPAASDSTSSSPSVADEVIRLHILADSDNEKDQTIKLTLRDTLLPYLNAATVTASSKAEALTQLTGQCEFLTELANQTLEELGVSYRATVSVTNLYFPIRIYGSQTYLSSDAVIFPPGYYDSVQVVLGSGEGHNWWCLAYPSLCFIDSSYDYIPKDSDLYKLKIGTVPKNTLEELFYGTTLTNSLYEEAEHTDGDEITFYFGSKLWELIRDFLG